MHRSPVPGIALLLAFVSASQPQPAMAAATNIKCTMKFTMKGRSASYKIADGGGTIRCNNGRSMKVSLSAKGGGLTVGKSSIEEGLFRDQQHG